MKNNPRFTWIGACMAVLWTAGGSAAAPVPMLDPADPRTLQVHQLHDEITLANLVNGLNLTGEQLSSLAELATEADLLRDEYTVASEPVLAEMAASFTDLRRELLVLEQPMAGVAQRAHRAESGFKDLSLEFARELAGLETEARVVLDEGQIQIVAEFRPCLLPPESLSSPLRVGQAGVSGRVMERLGEVRQLPPNTYTRRLPRLLDEAIERLEHHRGPLDESTEQAERDRVAAIIEDIRAMDDITWELEGESMAGQLVAPLLGDLPPADGGTELTRVGRILLAPGAAQVFTAVAARP